MRMLSRKMTNTMDKLTIRPIQQADAAAIQQYASDPRIAATCNVPHPYPDGAAEQFIRYATGVRDAGTAYVFSILLDGEFAGLMSLNDVNLSEGTAALDYWVAVPFWGKGIGSAAARLVVDFAFGALGLRELHSGCLARNPASARVLEKAGFTEVGSMVHDGAGTGKFTGETIRLFQQKHSE